MTETRWPHQDEAITMATEAARLNKRGFGIWHEMATGKTRTAIDTIDVMWAQRVLVVCPRNVIPVWPQQFARWSEREWITLALTKGSSKRKAEEVEQLRADTATGYPVAVVVNYESFWRKPLFDQLRKVPWDVVIFDEAHRLKTPSSRQSRAASVLRGQSFVLGLSGTPLPHSPLDAWAIYRTVAPGVFAKTYSQFKQRYLRPAARSEWRDPDIHIENVRGTTELVRYKLTRQDELRERMYSVGHRVLTADVLDLPEYTDNVRVAELEPKARRIYRELASEMIAWVNDESEPVVAANALVRILRLQQVTGGTVRDAEDIEHRVSMAKQDLLRDMLDDMLDEPVVVFGRFRSDLDAIREATHSAGMTYWELSGQRREVDLWLGEPDSVLGVQIQAGGEGIDLTHARICIYYSLSHSLSQYQQSRARVLRPGQARAVAYYHLVAAGTIDEAIYRALDARAEVVAAVVEGMRHGQT